MPAPAQHSASASTTYDVIVVGGGHNGLITAAYLTRAGKRVVVLEAREQVGGAAITERPWGPDYKVTALSYVVSLLPPRVQQDLRLERFGYRVHPQGPYFVPHPDGRSLRLPDDPARRHAAVSQFSRHDADALAGWDQWLRGMAGTLGPLLSTVPPKLGSSRPSDLRAQASLAWRLRSLGVRGVGDITRLLSMSEADLLEERFESPAVQGVLAVSGVIGTWAGPRSPGTAFVLLHHQLGDVGQGRMGTWGFPEGGMGALTQAMAGAAAGLGAEIRTSSPVARIEVAGGRVTGVSLVDGTALQAPVVVTTVHPQLAFLRMVDPDVLPPEFVADIQRWRSRSGVVKVNLAVDRLPEFASAPGFDPEVHGGTIVLARSLDEIERAFQDAVQGQASLRPFADICIPSVFDRTLAPEGHHVVSMFTQWVPHDWVLAPHHDEIAAHADRVVALVEEVAPGFTASVRHRQVIGPYEMEHEYGLVGGNIFHGELTPSQMFHLRPAPGYADFRTPIAGWYQAGSATHGGGGVTGLPALQVVGQIERDQRAAARRQWWPGTGRR